MRIGSVQPGRPAYYDRNAFTQALLYQAGGIAPHGGTTRFFYTVPTNEKNYLQSVICHIIRDGAAANPGTVTLQIQWGTDVGGGGIAAIANINDGAVGAKDNSNMGGLGHMTSGNTLSAVSSDGSVNGTVRYDVGAVIARFDQ